MINLTVTTHNLKTCPDCFEAIKSGRKKFEVRRNDRDFKVGDLLMLYEYFPISKQYSGERLIKIITFILPGGQFGIDPDFCVMSISDP